MYAHQINQTHEIKFAQNELILEHAVSDPTCPRKGKLLE